MSNTISTTGYTSSKTTSTTATKTNTLGKDEFLKILVTQLKNQDPMQPMQDTDFIAQMAQFSSVEQLMNMSENMGKLSQNLGLASSMIGKEVAWYQSTEAGTSVESGVVESIVVRDGIQYAVVGASNIPIDEIVSIGQGGETTNE
ncbi:flagellar basal-body rod modification protein FlgD [Paenibacillus phyllosphaerae]|uniref:Flagellar basal-body rod modification protein FlgD n=1 Tax=Paenibacillus phyllosphaerae TaxID=274593 RepID=A0A7W5AV63_9BACL|nr:flagellar hook assembly protein FlgD [Paenibacillus phyllosphaerae]MBB3109395.1 flagellar basal-body rod modification protein FlgD [Paenibacillus phyllosphaerae]